MAELTEKKELTHQQQKDNALFEGMSLVGIPKNLHIVDEDHPGLLDIAPDAVKEWAQSPLGYAKGGTGWNIHGGHNTRKMFIMMARASYLNKIRTRCVSLEQVVRWLDYFDDPEGRRDMLYAVTALFIKDFSDNTDPLLSPREQFIVTRLIRHRFENDLQTNVHYAGSVAITNSTWWSQDLLAELNERNRTVSVPL